MVWAVFLTQSLLASVGSQLFSTAIILGSLGLEQEEDEKNSLWLQKKSDLCLGDEEAWYCVLVLDGAVQTGCSRACGCGGDPPAFSSTLPLTAPLC